MSGSINETAKKIIDKFLEIYISPRIVDKDNLLGVLVYGSATTGYFDKNSDIDLLVLLNYAEKSIRGVQHIGETKVEYFIKPIEKFLSEGVSFTFSNCPSHLAMNQNCEILYGQKDFIKNMLDTDNYFYNQNHRPPNQNFDQKLVQIDNRLASLQNIYSHNGKEFEMVYYNILEMIRTLHCAHSGEADIPFVKAYRIYCDSDYYKKYVGENAKNPMPDSKFVDRYKKCIEETQSNDTMLNNLNDIFSYEKSFYDINPSNYELTF